MSVRTRELFRKATSLKRAMSRKRVYAVRTSWALPRTGSHTPLRSRASCRIPARFASWSARPVTPEVASSSLVDPAMYSLQVNRLQPAGSGGDSPIPLRGCIRGAGRNGYAGIRRATRTHADSSATPQGSPTEPSADPHPVQLIRHRAGHPFGIGRRFE
jgi:hypothetical protein